MISDCADRLLIILTSSAMQESEPRNTHDGSAVLQIKMWSSLISLFVIERLGTVRFPVFFK